MSVSLLAIKFSELPNPQGMTALNVRKNARETVPIPQWQAGISVTNSHSLVAYSTARTLGRPVLIQARFARNSPATNTVQIRAIPVSPVRLLWQWLESFLSLQPLWIQLAFDRALSTQDHVLGAIKPRWITFPSSGETDYETFELPNHYLWSTGVGIHRIEWCWQFRKSENEPWTNLATTRHRVYAVLDVPSAPWMQAPLTPENTQLPWTDVFDYACTWASGATTPVVAAAAITKAVYELGPAVIQYGCPILAPTQYASPYFDCTAFLERLTGGFGNGPFVNCTDCATIVSTFANALGCDLWQSQMRPLIGFQFATNPVCLIGDAVFGQPCNIFSGFVYHEVAWARECDSDDGVFDACLLLSDGFNPGVAPFIPLLPANLPFATIFGRSYRQRLVTQAQQANCVPFPSTRQRRFVV